MNKKLTTLLASTVLLVLPFVAFAIPAVGGIPNFQAVGNAVLGVIWPLFIGFSIIMFIISGFMFLTARGDPGKAKLAASCLMWGVVGVVVGVIAFSIPTIIGVTLGVPGVQP